MESGQNITAIIAAAGQGKRMERDFNKQYILLNNKPIIIHTLEVFENNELISDIILVVGKDEVDFCKKEIIEKYNFKKISKVTAGGEERKNSVYAGLLLVNIDCSIVVIHDGARPFITKEIINESIKQAALWGAAVTAVPVKDTIKKVNKSMEVKQTLNRDELWSVQTPQTFQYKLIKKAYEDGIADFGNITDDAMMAEKINCAVKILKGSYDNIKITTPEDLEIAEVIIKRRESKCE